jgi:hypothetical protein
MPPPNELSAIDFVNPYLSTRRQWVCTQLASVLPNTVTKLMSSDPATRAKFEEWTGQSQSKLETAWTNEGFKRATTPEERQKGVWVRNGDGPVTTSCEGLIGTLFRKIEAAGHGHRAKTGTAATSFSLCGCDKWGKEPDKPVVGWHWFSERSKSVRPRAGDFFQVGIPAGNKRWELRHVGVITGYTEGDNPQWETVEAGQGGPSAGADWMQRKPWRPVNPVDIRNTKKVLMGWLDIDEHFGG